MTFTATEPRIVPVAPALEFAEVHERQARARGLSWWRDSLQAIAVLSLVATVAFFLASGPLAWSGTNDMLLALGRFAGLGATALMLLQVTLASRAPWIERAIGHDRSLKLHASLGGPVFTLLVVHAALLIWVYSAIEGRGIVDEVVYQYGNAPRLALAYASFGALLIVGITSIAAVRRLWPYETWHAIHLTTYVAVGLSVPHQFWDGSTFQFTAVAAWFWVALYAIAFGSLLAWRVGLPARRALRHRLRVSSVEPHADGSTSITMTGRHLEEWFARPGQFFLWRFFTRELWGTTHPYSLSAAPDGASLRITVKPLGDDSAAVANLRPGARVFAAGPYGRFHHGARVGRGVVLVAGGIGVTPVRAMLEDDASRRGACHVILRARSPQEAPLLEELRALANARGAVLHELYGSRGAGWSGGSTPVTLAQLVPGIEDSDVFVCGPEAWAQDVVADARASGVAEDAIHVEEYAW